MCGLLMIHDRDRCMALMLTAAMSCCSILVSINHEQLGISLSHV